MRIYDAWRMSASAGDGVVGRMTGSVIPEQLETLGSEQLCEYWWPTAYRILELAIAPTGEAIRRALR